MNLQPNFEKVKKAFYDLFANSTEANFSILAESLTGRLQPSFHLRKDAFRQDLNQWLDRVDIRAVGQLIDVIIEKGGSLPRWIKNKKYTIDYNDREALDLINLEVSE